jgi:hypothetical protein
MSVSLTLFLICLILLLDLLILITMRYMILMTNCIKELYENSDKSYNNTLKVNILKRNVVDMKSNIERSNVIYFNSYCKVK